MFHPRDQAKRRASIKHRGLILIKQQLFSVENENHAWFDLSTAVECMNHALDIQLCVVESMPNALG